MGGERETHLAIKHNVRSVYPFERNHGVYLACAELALAALERGGVFATDFTRD